MSGSDRQALGSRYELIEKIGQGASGSVWLTWDRQTGQEVATKLLWPHYARDPEIVTRFIREKTILTSLQHPNIIRVHDLVAEGDNLGIVMDLARGPSLTGLLRQAGGTLPAVQAVPFIISVLDGLDYAHSKGVFHRDLKPDNILLAVTTDPQPQDIRLADFGIADLTHDDVVSRTQTVGTPHYMSPELIAYGQFGALSDVYSVGITLYELLAGRTPFGGDATSGCQE